MAGLYARDGCIVLADSEIRWGHGGESDTAHALDAASDLSDMSDELAALGRKWPAACDCGRERGHLLRGLDLRAEMRVLEVGAGCGGATRHIAERCAIVDALEPNPERARLAARRLSDLPGAAVLVGEIEDLPDEPAYDVIVLVGVLEYVGGWRGIDDRIAFLRRLAGLLLPGGHLVCGIENRFGISYFAGQPDDHSGLLFQTVEGHPHPRPSRTFSRIELERLFTTAGLLPTTLGVFPDYRFPRLVFSADLLTGPARSIAWGAPHFPTLRHQSYEPTFILDEGRVWRGFVENGIGREFPNSFLVVAGRDEPQQLWPSGQLAAFYSTGRRRRFATESRVLDLPGESGLVVRRRLLAPPGLPRTAIRQRGAQEPFRIGDTLLDALIDADPDGRKDLLVRYCAFAAAEIAPAGRDVPFDIWPGNIIVSADELFVVDTEFAHSDLGADEVVPRGLLLTAIAIAERTPAERWQATTVGELLSELAELAGVEVPLEATVQRQSELVAEIFGGEPESDAWREHRDRAIADLHARLARPLTENIFGARDAGARMHMRVTELERARADTERWGRELEAALAAAQSAYDAAAAATTTARDEATAATARAQHLEREFAVLANSRSWRLTRPMRRAGNLLRNGRPRP